MIHKENILKRHIKGYVGGSIAFFSFLSMFGIGFSNWVIAAEGDVKYTDLTIEADTVITENKYIQCFDNIKITQPLYYSDTYGYLGDDEMFSTASGVEATIKGTFGLNIDNVKTTDTVNYQNMTITFSMDNSKYSISSSNLEKTITNENVIVNSAPDSNVSYSITINASNITFVTFSFSVTIKYKIDFASWDKKPTLYLSLA